MEKIFISGSMKIKNLHSSFKDRLREAIADGYEFLVGDASGSDTSIQEFLLSCGSPTVTVYCAGPVPRNNVGNWPVNNVYPSAPEGTRSFFTAKDIQMAEDSSSGIMIWDSASTGTLSNVFELTSRGKKSEVFVNKLKRFIPVNGAEDIAALISVMSPGAYQKADQKIGIRKKMDKLNSSQLGFGF